MEKKQVRCPWCRRPDPFYSDFNKRYECMNSECGKEFTKEESLMTKGEIVEKRKEIKRKGKERMEKIKKMSAILTPIGAIILTLIIAGFVGGTNPYTPAGHEGYVYMKPIFLGKGGFAGTTTGPCRYGLSWRKYVTNVDMRPRAYKEKFKIRMKDNLNVTVDIVLKASPKDGEIKGLIEGLGEEWYERFVQPEFRSICRKAITRYDSEEIPRKRDVVTNEILNGYSLGNLSMVKGIIEIVGGNHVEIHSVTISNVDYPHVVDREIERKMEARQNLEKKQTELQIAEKEAEIRIAEAKGIAKAQDIINKTLTVEYLQHEAIDAMKALVNSNNTTFFVMPTSPTGAGLPMVVDPTRMIKSDK